MTSEKYNVSEVSIFLKSKMKKHWVRNGLYGYVQGSFLVRSRDFPENFSHIIFAIGFNHIYVKVYLKTSLFSKYYLSMAIFLILAEVQSF